MRLKDLTGERFGRLLVQQQGERKRGRTTWVCLCDCGAQVTVVGHELGKRTNSCGCLKKETTVARFRTHGKSNTPEHRAYHAARNRCGNPNFKQYSDYGGRGIKFLYRDFVSFISDVGDRPSSKHSLERKDVNGNYECGNCCWATSMEQFHNRRVVLVSQQMLEACVGTALGTKIWTQLRGMHGKRNTST